MDYRSPSHAILLEKRTSSAWMVATIIIVCGALSAGTAATQAQQVWPKIPLPKNASPFLVSDGTIEVNGLPTRMQGFLSPEKPAEVRDWFRQKLDSPLAENRIGSKLILGQEQDGHYTTIQLEPAGKGTRGIVSVASIKESAENLAREQAVRERWQARLPAGSRLISRVVSEDGGKQANHLVIMNSHDEGLNRERITSLMLEDGLELERDATSAAAQDASGERKTLYFKGRGKEAIATIFRERSGQTAIVLNTVITIENFK